MTSATTEAPVAEQKLVRGLGLLDSTMLVAGSMIGSGLSIVSSIIARQVGSPGWLLAVWIVTGLLTLTAALSYGELAAMMPKAGGQYVYLREAFSPLWGFLYGWTLFLVIQTGTIAAVAVGFARYSGVLLPWISESNYIISPIRFGGYALSLSTAQLVGLALIGFLTFTNTRGLEVGKLIQNVFTTAKTGALLALIVLGIVIGLKSGAGAENFRDFWTVRGNLQEVGAGLTAATVFGLFVGICVAQTNSLFSADAWNNITFTAGEVVNPRRNVPAWALVFQGIWAGALVLPRTVKTDAAGSVTGYGNLYGNLLDYVISAALIFYVLTIIGIFLLRRKQPHAERPYKAFGYPVVPILYILGATVILVVLFIYQTATTWPGLIIVLTGVPVYFFWNKSRDRKIGLDNIDSPSRTGTNT